MMGPRQRKKVGVRGEPFSMLLISDHSAVQGWVIIGSLDDILLSVRDSYSLVIILPSLWKLTTMQIQASYKIGVHFSIKMGAPHFFLLGIACHSDIFQGLEEYLFLLKDNTYTSEGGKSCEHFCLSCQ